MINIIGRKFIALGFSLVLVVASIVAIAVYRLPLGIDFTGGTIMQVRFQATPNADTGTVVQTLADAGFPHAVVQFTDSETISIKTRTLSNEDRTKVMSTLSGKFGAADELRFDAIGATISKDLQQKSLVAVGLVVGMLLIYIAWVFRKVSGIVPSWKFALAAIVALIHDLVIMVGFYAVLAHFTTAEVDTYFVTALLTILGYSVNDTIVVFDRVRSRLLTKPKESLASTFNTGLVATLTRSLNIALTVEVVLVVLLVFGSPTLRPFLASLLVGVIAGTYSSIFVASPLVVWWHAGKKK